MEAEIDIYKPSLSDLNTVILLPLFAIPYKARKLCREHKDECPDKYTQLISDHSITSSWDDVPIDKEGIIQWVSDEKADMFSGPYHVGRSDK